jgi:phosphatidylserine/phosphatidylglycerophosphate/cardiolipin synthase-like enzyme
LLFSRTWINFVTLFSQRLLAQIRRVAQELPTPTLNSAIEVLMKSESQSLQSLKTKLLSGLPKASWRSVVAELIEIWQVEARHLDGNAIATALATAAHCETASRQELSAQLVWTGPNPEGMPLRRTDQTLLQMIREAQEELILVSFAVYKIPEIAQELIAAQARGVSLRIIAETPESSEGKIPFGVITALGTELAQLSQVFIWPKDKRPTDKDGRYGSLHVKCAVCDNQYLFISSANLTEYALALNMEMGVLVHSQDLATRVTRHIDCLISQRILVPMLEPIVS